LRAFSVRHFTRRKSWHPALDGRCYRFAAADHSSISFAFRGISVAAAGFNKLKPAAPFSCIRRMMIKGIFLGGHTRPPFHTRKADR
jgi:hypothetical protein